MRLGVEMMKAAREGLWNQSDWSLSPADLNIGSSDADFQISKPACRSSSFIMLRRQPKWLDGVVCSAQERPSHQAGYQRRFYLSDTGHSPAGAAWRSKNVMTPADVNKWQWLYCSGIPLPAEDPVAAYHAIKDEWTQTEIKNRLENKRRIPWHLQRYR